MKVRGALDHRLALTIERKDAIVALVGSKLLGGSNNGQSFAVPNEDCALARSDEDSAVFRVIDVEVGSDIEDEVLAILAIIYIVLLLFDGVDLFYLEAIGLVFISIIVRVVFLLHCLRLQDISLEGRPHGFLNWLLYQRDFLSNFLGNFNDHFACSGILIVCGILLV